MLKLIELNKFLDVFCNSEYNWELFVFEFLKILLYNNELVYYFYLVFLVISVLFCYDGWNGNNSFIIDISF